MIKADFLTGLGLIVLSLYVIIESWNMPRMEHLRAHPLSVPGLVPAFLAVVILLLGTVLVIRSIRCGGHRLGWSRETVRQALRVSGNQRLLLTAALTLGYAVFLVGTLPYWFATGLFIFLFVLLFEGKRGMSFAEWRRCVLGALLVASIASATVTLVFERLFLVTLP